MAYSNIVRRLSPLMLMATVAACGGGADIPEAQLSRADLAVQRAVAAKAGERAPAELAKAQSELTAARQASDEERYTDARRLADLAESNATLAEARADAAGDTKALDQMQDTVGDLRETAAPKPLSPAVTP